ncbi:MAG: MBL fold metallo-hydrolase [Lachnospiraceae bacterium]|nr:MBL fold metallo-hydrolase [Lachnospiraceae bacterium]
MGGIRIYRGADQIGGIVTEISNGQHRILIDFGANLPGTDNSKLSDDDLVKKVFDEKACVFETDAVLFTHYHGDHTGLKNRIPENVPLYIGKLSKDIMSVIAKRVDYVKEKNGINEEPELPVINRMKPYWKLKSWKDFNGIRVMPLVCDHSAIDAHMFIIELNNKRILYTGDFRDHGIPGEETFEKMIRDIVGKVDILIVEGTMVSREDETAANKIRTEEDLEKKAKEIFNVHKENVVLVSSTNLDSVMGFYHATPGDKAFLCDAYQAEIMRLAVEARHKYYPNRYRYKKAIYVLCPDEYEGYIKELKKYNSEETRCNFQMAKPSIYLEKGFVMLARPNRNPLMKCGHFEEHMQQMKDPFITYSMWEGYLEDGKAPDKAIVNFVKNRTDNEHMERLHVSGHAYVETLRKLMDITDPDIIIPMHTENRDAFKKHKLLTKYSDRIQTVNGDEIYEV